MHHEDRKHVVDRIDEIESAAGAVPAIFAKRPRGTRRRRGAYGEAETEPAVRSWEVEGIVYNSGLRTDLVRRHQYHRLGLEVACAVQLASIEQHLQEVRVIPDRGVEPRTAGFKAPRQCRILDAGQRTVKAIGRQRPGNARPLGLISDKVTGLGHAERIEQSLLFKLE